jgi:hypothetical protein
VGAANAARFPIALSNERCGRRSRKGTEVRSQIATALDVVLMAAMIVAIDLLFFKNRFWQRLTVNLGIVLIFAAFYFRFLKRP